MPRRSLVIYCDESDDKGRYYSHFYGGALVRAEHVQEIEDTLNALKAELNINSEMKWDRVTGPYKEKYIRFIEAFFEFVAKDMIKVRIMFTQNINVPSGLTDEHIGNDYFLLYYQFIKHAFGLRYCNGEGESALVTLLMDDIPQTREKFEGFKDYISSLSAYPIWHNARVLLPRENIHGVDSKRHVILQGLDITLGAIQSRLNEKHTRPEKPKARRSKRARAKEGVYTAVKDCIWGIYPNFNVGTSTACKDSVTERWSHQYRHWLFKPNNSVADLKRGKKNS